MDYGTGATDPQARIERLESQLKAFRVILVFVFFMLFSLFWRQIRPGIVRASQFEVVDGAGKTVAELSQKNGGAHLILYGTSHEPAGEFSVVGSDASIVLYDGERKQRAALAMMVGAPTLVMHDAEGDVRALLTAGDYNSLFGVKDKDGFATILGNAIDETRKIEKVDGKDVPHDTVKITSGVSIRIQDAKRNVLWKAP